MFELPETVILASQFNETLRGKTVGSGSLGNKPHKFVWYNRTREEFAQLTAGRCVGKARAQGRWLFVPLEPGYVLVLGECGGQVLYHPPGTAVPQTYHLHIAFTDGSALTATTQMWGAMELYEQGQERDRQYVKDMRPTPLDACFTFEYLAGLIDGLLAGEKRSVKGLLTQDQLIPGLGNAIAQDILFNACLHPRHALADLTRDQQRALYEAILATVHEVIRRGGRYDEVDLYNRPGGYIRIMDRQSVGRPCPRCGGRVEKMQYLGGTCYFCGECQK